MTSLAADNAAAQSIAEQRLFGLRQDWHACRLKADGDKQCRLKVEYQLVYVTSVNAFIKKAIERGKTPC